jgi:ABC-type antimicrobial peptide transport system permease subunit
VKLLLGNDWRLGDSVIVAGRPHKLIGVIKDTFRSRYLTELSGNELVLTPYNKLSGQMLPSEQIVLNIHHDEVDTFNISDVADLIQTDNSSFDIESIDSLASLLEDEVYIARITAIMAISFCVLTLLLGTVGVWGIVNYNAITRRFEFGVRLALGANRVHLLTMMLIENTLPLLLGIISGLVIALVASTQITHLSLFMEQIGQFDVRLIILMLFTLVLAMLFAVINPVNQVIRNAPMDALKQDD